MDAILLVALLTRSLHIMTVCYHFLVGQENIITWLETKNTWAGLENNQNNINVSG